HVPGVFRIVGGLDKNILEESIRFILKRHEVLRTLIVEEDGLGYQQVRGAEDFEIEVHVYREGEEDLGLLIEERVMSPFDLSRDYMLRVSLVEEGEDSCVLVLVMHHIASDGWSLPIFVRELEHVYGCLLGGGSIDLPVLEVQYGDYSIWQRKYLTGDVLANKLGYWKEQLSGTEVLELPTDYVRPSTPTVAGRMYSFEIGKELRDG